MFTRFNIRPLAPLSVVFLLAMAGCAPVGAEPQERSLESRLELGESPSYYWTALERLGYRVTAVNYDTEDYVEYEVVRGDESYEVQIVLDAERRATEIDVTANLWKAEATSEALEAATVTVPASTHLILELDEYVSSAQAEVGQQVSFRLAEPVIVGEMVAVPTGATVTATVVEVEKAERPQKPGRLMLAIDTLRVHGSEVDIQAQWLEKGEGSHKADQKEIGIGAAVGAVVGAIVEGVPGAIAGIVLGGGGVFLATKGEDVELPDGTRLTVELKEPVSVPRH